VEPKPPSSSAAPENPPGWVLPEALEHLSQSGADSLVTELLGDFRADVAARLLRLRQAVARNDAATIKIEVHSIKGSAAQMGAAGLAAACRQVEIEARTGQGSLTEAQLDGLQALFDEVCRDIGRHPLGSGSG
jgi:HPt (histidine-containing phosphotransfer) domain-containing protein